MSTTVEPHRVKRTIPAGFNHLTMEHMPERVVEHPNGYLAHRSALSAWSMNEEAALSMLDRMEAAKRA